tara:strand:- start:378 stop:914 length:537 start_codon:yes stop_codon:yes gene_type:complete
MRIFVSKGLFILILLIATHVYSKENYSWSIEKVNEKNVLVSINGKIQYGDMLYFYIPSSNCNSVENLFTFYTTTNNNKLDSLKSKPIPLTINNFDTYGEIRFMFPMLMGHQIWISLGNYNLDTLVKHLSDYDTLNVEIANGESFIPAEYFDISFNIWPLKGLHKAIDDGKTLCLASSS